MRYTLTTLALTLTALNTSAAQDSTRTWGFTSARADSYTAAFVYTGYGYRDVFIAGGVMYNPRSSYTELAGGAGARVRALGGSHFVVAMLAKAADARYAQFFFMPSWRVADLDVDATLEGYYPLEDAGAVQYYLTPLAATRRVTRSLSLGVAYELAYQRGTSASHFAGPTIRWTLPSAQVAVDMHAGMRNAPGKVRFAFKSFH